MNFYNAFKALNTHLASLSIGIPVYSQNDNKNPVANQAHALVYFMPAVVTPVTTSQSGMDQQSGIYQITLRYPSGQGSKDILEKADSIAQHYKAGQSLLAPLGNEVVKLLGAEIAPPVAESGWFSIPVSIKYTSFVRR